MKKLILFTIALSFLTFFASGQDTIWNEIEEKRTNHFRIQSHDGTPLEDAAIGDYENIWDYFLMEYLVQPSWPRWRSDVEDRVVAFAKDEYGLFVPKDEWGFENVGVYRKWIVYRYYTIQGQEKNAIRTVIWKPSGARYKNYKAFKYAAWNAYYAFLGYLKAEPITKFKQVRGL